MANPNIDGIRMAQNDRDRMLECERNLRLLDNAENYDLFFTCGPLGKAHKAWLIISLRESLKSKIEYFRSQLSNKGYVGEGLPAADPLADPAIAATVDARAAEAYQRGMEAARAEIALAQSHTNAMPTKDALKAVKAGVAAIEASARSSSARKAAQARWGKPAARRKAAARTTKAATKRSARKPARKPARKARR